MNQYCQDILNSAVSCLQNGGVLLHPTDTVWGLACNPNNDSAVEKIVDIKGRPKDKPFILLATTTEMLANHFSENHLTILSELSASTEIPTTVILPLKLNRNADFTSNQNTLAVRLIEEPFNAQMIHQFGLPILSTSANLSGKPAPLQFKSIDKNILSRVNYVVGEKVVTKMTGKPSRIIKVLTDGGVEVIRGM